MEKHEHLAKISEKLNYPHEIYPLMQILGKFPKILSPNISNNCLTYEQIMDGMARNQTKFFLPYETFKKDEKLGSKKSKLKSFRNNLATQMDLSLNPITNCKYQANKQRIKMVVDWFFGDILNHVSENVLPGQVLTDRDNLAIIGYRYY